MGKEKKEIGKLLELLNEYSELRLERLTGEEGQPIRKRHDYELEYPIEKIRVISKQYGFIKWLVDNDKIRKDIYRPIPFKIKIEYEDSVRYIEKLEDRILMELSIQDEPIEFLVSVLK